MNCIPLSKTLCPLVLAFALLGPSLAQKPPGEILAVSGVEELSSEEFLVARDASIAALPDSGRAVKRSRPVIMNRSAFENDSTDQLLRIEFFPDVVCLAEHSHTKRHSDNAFTWWGRCAPSKTYVVWISFSTGENGTQHVSGSMMISATAFRLFSTESPNYLVAFETDNKALSGQD